MSAWTLLLVCNDGDIVERSEAEIPSSIWYREGDEARHFQRHSTNAQERKAIYIEQE